MFYLFMDSCWILFHNICFFIFLKTDFSQSFITFAKNKLIRFMPLIWFICGVWFVTNLFIPIGFCYQENIFSLLNIQNVGVTFQSGDFSSSWFVSSLFWTMCFYNNISCFLGKNTFAIFLTHNFVISVYGILIYQKNWRFPMHHPILNLVVLFLIIIIFGILTHYKVEIPATKYLKEKFK